MKELTIANPVVGIYIHDSGGISITGNQKSVWKAKESDKYLPLLNLFTFHNNNDIKFTTGENVSDDIATHNENETIRRFSPSVMSKSKLDVTQNDLIGGHVYVMLNFTKYNLTITAEGGLPKLYRPLTNTNMPEYQGSLVILSVLSLGTPSEYKGVYGLTNYLDTLKEKYRNQTASGYRKATDLIDRIQSYWSMSGNTSDASPSSTFKVCRCMKITESSLLEKGVFQDVYLRDIGFVVSGKSVTEVDDHPSLGTVGLDDRQLVDVVRVHGVSCYIVDPDDEIGERYFSIAGSVRVVPKLKSKDAAKGLYIVSSDGNVRIASDSFTPLADIDKNRFIFKSREEAETGADVKTLLTHEVELNKINRSEEIEQLRMAGIRAKHESDERMAKLERQLMEDRARHEREMLDAKRRHEIEMSGIKKDHREMDMSFDRVKYSYDERSLKNKSSYEEERFARDSTIETLKTAGSLAGLAVAGMMAYRRFS